MHSLTRHETRDAACGTPTSHARAWEARATRLATARHYTTPSATAAPPYWWRAASLGPRFDAEARVATISFTRSSSRDICQNRLRYVAAIRTPIPSRSEMHGRRKARIVHGTWRDSAAWVRSMAESSSKMSGMLNAKFGAVTVSSGPTRAAVVCTRGRRTKTRRGMISTARPGVAKGTHKQTCPRKKKHVSLALERAGLPEQAE